MIRLVAECRKLESGCIAASVEPLEVPLTHPLAQVNGARNRLIIEPEAGDRVIVSGSGAGRWPTTEAVMADLFEVRRQCASLQSDELEVCVA